MSVQLFAGQSYYPAGGWGDLVGEFPTVDAARERVAGTRRERFWAPPGYSVEGLWVYWEFDWAHIVDDGKIVMVWHGCDGEWADADRVADEVAS